MMCAEATRRPTWSRRPENARPRRVLVAAGRRARLSVVLLAAADPAHHLAQATPALLDAVGLPSLAQLVEDGPARLVLEDPLAGERPGLDLAEDLAHLRARRLAD